MTELAQPGGVVLEQGEAPEWVELVEGEWVAQEPVQVWQGSVFVPNAELSQLMRLEFLALLSNAPNVGQRW